jgi:hypothetical protein
VILLEFNDYFRDSDGFLSAKTNDAGFVICCYLNSKKYVLSKIFMK